MSPSPDTNPAAAPATTKTLLPRPTGSNGSGAPTPPGIPLRPRLKPFIDVVPIRDDYLLLHGPNLFLRISDEGVPLFQKILPLLDGSNDFATILRSSGARSEELADVLSTLHEQGIIEDAALETPLDLSASARAYVAPQLNIFSNFTYDANQAQRRLLQANVLVVGAGPVGAAAADVLHAAGVGTISVVDSRTPQPFDRYAARLAMDGMRRSQALAASIPPRHGLSRIAPIDSVTVDFRSFDNDELHRLVKAQDHVVVALETQDSTLLAAVNEACLRAGVAWTPAELYGPVAHIGPTVLARKTACWRCYDLRRKGAQPGLDRYLMYEAHRERRPDDGRAREGLLPSYGPVVGSIAAQEAITSISRFTLPALLGRVLVFDLIAWTSQRHRVLRLPRCPACGAAEIPDVDRFDTEPVYL